MVCSVWAVVGGDELGLLLVGCCGGDRRRRRSVEMGGASLAFILSGFCPKERGGDDFILRWRDRKIWEWPTREKAVIMVQRQKKMRAELGGQERMATGKKKGEWWLLCLWWELEERKPQKPRGGSRVFCRDQGILLGFLCVALSSFKIPPPPLLCVVKTGIYKQSGLVPKMHWSLNFLIFCKF